MLNELLTRYPQLAKCADVLKAAATAMIVCYKNGGKILLCGNGGSCTDCDHIVGELMKGFLKNRPLSSKQKEKMKSRVPLLDEEILSSIYIQPNDIITIGFTADVSIEITNHNTRKVILDNISYLEDTNAYKIAIPYGVATDMWGNKSIPYIIDDLSFDF